MTNSADSQKGYKFKIEIQDIFIRDAPPGKFYQDKDKPPEIKCSVYGNSATEVLIHLDELMNQMKELRWHKK